MLLKRLTTSLPDHLSALLPVLDYAGIKTTENLLFTPLSTLHDLLDTIPPHTIDELIAVCDSLSAPETQKGDVILAREKGKSKRWEGFGIASVDDMFDRWSGSGVIELCGPKRVGKSLLALHAALRILTMDDSATCYWIDTEGSFAPDRARAILESWGMEVSGVLDRLIVSPCFQVDPDTYDVLGRIQAELDGEDDAGSSSSKRVRVVVLDTAPVLFKDQLLNTSSQGHAAMISVMETLAELTHQYQLLTIFTNSVSSSVPTNPLSTFSATAIKPSLGTAFGYCADVTILVQETGKLFGMVDAEERERTRKAPGLRAVVEVLRSRISAAGQWSVFETDGIRLFDVIPPPLEDERTIRRSAGLPVGDERPRVGALRETLRP